VKPEAQDTTALLQAWAGGDQAAFDALMPRVYADLRRLAGRFMQGENPGGTMQATALVHELYLRLVDVKHVDWQGRTHFFAMCAHLMRRILLDRARRRMAGKRGGRLVMLPLERIPDLGAAKDRQLIAIDDALNALAALDARKGKIVELRYFGGLSIEETALMLHVSKETVARDWRFAKSWLLRQISGARTAPAPTSPPAQTELT